MAHLPKSPTVQHMALFARRTCMRKMTSTSVLGVVLCILCALLVHHGIAQDVLAVSSFQTCTSVSYGEIQLDCDQTESTVSVLLVRTATTLRPGGNVSGSPTSYIFQMASLPPSGGTNTGGDSNLRCTKPDKNNQCGESQRVKVTVNAEPPVRRFRLREIAMLDIPFSYYFSLVDGDCSTEECIADRTNKYKGKDCTFQGATSVQSQTSSDKVTPTASQIKDWFNRTQVGRIGLQPGFPINCPTREPGYEGYTEPNGQVVDPGSSVLQYNFKCKKENVKFYASFYQLAPMCRAFRVEQSEVVGRVTVSIEKSEPNGYTRSVTINTAQYETAGVTEQGDMLVRILNVQSPTDTLSETLPGILFQCGDSVPVEGSQEALYEVPLIDMFRPLSAEQEADVLVNPWNYLSDEEVEYTYPTPQMINKVRDKDTPAPNQFYFYMEPSDALTVVGNECGQLGVDPDFYRSTSQQVQASYYAKKVSLSYNEIRQLNGFGTCVPEFGFSFRGINVTTPCSAAAYFHTQNRGSAAERKARFDSERRATPLHLPRGFTAPRQNLALQNDYMYVYQQLDAQWEVSIALRATLLGVVNKPYAGTISRTEFTGCSLELDNPNKAGTVAAYVCSGVPDGSPALATYTVYAECDPFSELVVKVPTQVSTNLLQAGECTLVTFDLIEQFAVPFGVERFCTVYLGSTGQPVFSPDNSLTIDSVTLLCDRSNLGSNFSAENLLIDPEDALTLSNATIVSRKNYTVPEPPDKDTSWYLWGFLSIALGAVALVIAGGLLFWARVSISHSAKMKVVD